MNISLAKFRLLLSQVTVSHLLLSPQTSLKQSLPDLYSQLMTTLPISLTKQKQAVENFLLLPLPLLCTPCILAPRPCLLSRATEELPLFPWQRPGTLLVHQIPAFSRTSLQQLFPPFLTLGQMRSSPSSTVLG